MTRSDPLVQAWAEHIVDDEIGEFAESRRPALIEGVKQALRTTLLDVRQAAACCLATFAPESAKDVFRGAIPT